MMTIFKQKDDKKTKTNVTKLGANWNNGLNTSAFYWNLNNASSNRNRNISSQLVNAQISLETPRQKWRGVLINQCTENWLPCHLAKH